MKYFKSSKAHLMVHLKILAAFIFLQAYLSVPIQAQAQQKVTGKVVDASGQPLFGVSITEENTQNGTLSDESGEYQLSVSADATLLFSYLGYKSEEVKVRGRAQISVSLEEDVAMLSQVVVVGYGTQQKSEITGSIASVNGDDLQNLPVSGASQALQGRAAGVNVVRNGGAPGSGASIRIRGVGTVNNAEPLVVIDGVPSGGMDDINPNDIESIEILKDASTAAIYGLRAANGVVLITTKRGKFDQKLSFTLNAYAGTSNPLKTLDVLEAPALAELKRERYTNDGIPGNSIWSESEYQSQKTDWQKELLGTGINQNYDFTLRGGGKYSAFALSGGFYDEQGMIKNSYYNKYYARINSDHKVGNRLKIGENLQLTRQARSSFNTLSAQSGVLWSAIRFHPGLPVKNSNGSYSSSQISSEFGDINNPIFTVDTQDQETVRNRVLGNIFAEFKILDGLMFKANFALDATFENSRNFSVEVLDQIRQNSINDLDQAANLGSSLLAEYYLNYHKTFAEKHDVTLVAGYTAQTFQTNNFSAGKDDFPNEEEAQRVLDAGRNLKYINGTKSEINLASAFTRLNYAYQGKYLLSATFRRDGTSRFAKENRWGNFPAFSLGWQVSKEPWFNTRGPISFLKVNGGWGRLGNQQVDPFQYLALISSGIRYDFGGMQVTGAALTRIPNEKIAWETTEMTDIGLEVGFLEEKILFSTNYFIKNTYDMLLAPPTLGTLGRATIPDQNVGEVKNQGLELELTFRQNIKDFRLNISANASFLKNEVLDLGGREFLASQFYGRPNQEISRTYTGHPIGVFYGWKANGLYQTIDEVEADPALANDPRKEQGLIQPGDVRFVDLNQDGKIDANDRTILGDPFPNLTYGLNTQIEYKNFDLNLYFLGVSGTEIYNADRMQGIDPTYPFNMYAETANRWTGPNTSNTIPRMSTKRDNLNHRTSDLFLEKGDFFRLKNLTLGYSLPKALLEKAKISRIRMYVSGQNVLTFTKYKGMDPELGYVDGNLQANVDYAQYPQARTFIFGTTLTF